MQYEILGVGTFQGGGINTTGEGSGMLPGQGKIKYKAKDYIKIQEEKNRKPRIWRIGDKKIIDKVEIGSAVKVVSLDNDYREDTFIIVEQNDADVNLNQVSAESPIGRVLLGAKIGEIVEVNAPTGVYKYKVLEIFNCYI